MRDAMRLNPPDLFSQIISRASKNISSFAEESQNQSAALKKVNEITILENKGKMLNVVETSTHSTEKQLKEISKVRDWLDSLYRDRDLFDQISDGINFASDSPYADIEKIIKEDRKNRENLPKSKRYLKEKLLEKEKNNLIKAGYTQSVITMNKNLLLMQRDIQEAMKPENILKNESSAALRFENLKKKLEIELKNRKETKKMLKKDLKEASKLFNNNVKYHKKLEEDLSKLENFQKNFQSKSSIEIIEKAKKNTFIKNQWKTKQKELLTQIREINIELEKYKNNEQTNQEISNIMYANNLEFEKMKKNYDEIIESINQDMKLSHFYQMSSLQILEKELINTLNFHRGIESKNSQTQIKMATTSFTRLFMKYSKEKQACFNKLDKSLRKSNATFETSIESLIAFKDGNKNVFSQSMNQIFDELNQIIKDYCDVFSESFEFNDKKLKLKAKNQIDILIGRKQRLSSQLLNRETDIALNLSAFKTIEGVYFDILKTFWPDQMDFDDDEKNSIQNFIFKASTIVSEMSKKLSIDLKSSKQKNNFNRKRSSSAITSPPSIKFNQCKNEVKIEISSKPQTIVQKSTEIEDDQFIDNSSQNSIESFQIKPLPPTKSEERSPRFQSQNRSAIQTKNSENNQGQIVDQKINSSIPSVPPDLAFGRNKKRKKSQSEIRNVIKDNSPHFSERKSRKPRREKSRAEIEEARRESILRSHQKSKRTMQDIPKIPFIKNVDPKMMNEIDSTYSFSNDSKSRNKVLKKEVQKDHSIDVSENRKGSNNDEFYCVKNNINVTKKNISELPFSKRKMTNKLEDSNKIYPFTHQNRNDFNEIAFFKNYSKSCIRKSATVNVISNVFDFSENILENKINQNENLHRKIRHEQNKEVKENNDYDYGKTKEMLRASLDLRNRRNENSFMIKNSIKSKKNLCNSKSIKSIQSPYFFK